MKALVLFIALAIYVAISNVESKPIEPTPVVFVMPRKRLAFPRRHCSNLISIGIFPSDVGDLRNS
ncbi:MAG: hypothetical protein M1395_06730 [Bacteroidetes bacterium]|nr:hypothetical protein [Bacteroidota bacterium]